MIYLYCLGFSKVSINKKPEALKGVKKMKVSVNLREKGLDEIKAILREKIELLTPEYHKGEYCRVRAWASPKHNREIGFGDGMGTQFIIEMYYANEYGSTFGWETENGYDHPILETICIPFDWVAVNKLLNTFSVDYI